MKFLFNVLFNRWFYLGTTVVVVLLYFFPRVQLGSISLPSLPSFHFSSIAGEQKVYIPQRQLSNTIIGVTYANITIGENALGITKEITYANDFEAMIQTNKKMQEYLDRDIIAMLDNAKQRETTLQSFINQLQYYIDQSQSVIDAARAKVRDWDAAFASCATNKQQADAAYLEALNAGDANAITSILADAEEYGQCETDLRIKINSYVLPLQQLQTTRDAAIQYVAILEQYFDNIVTYYDLLRDDILEELLLIKQQFGL